MNASEIKLLGDKITDAILSVASNIDKGKSASGAEKEKSKDAGSADFSSIEKSLLGAIDAIKTAIFSAIQSYYSTMIAEPAEKTKDYAKKAGEAGIVMSPSEISQMHKLYTEVANVTALNQRTADKQVSVLNLVGPGPAAEIYDTIHDAIRFTQRGINSEMNNTYENNRFMNRKEYRGE